MLKGSVPKPLTASIAENISEVGDVLIKDFKKLQNQYGMCGSDKQTV